LIFQTYALWPHLTVERNVAYPLERRKVAAAERKSRVAKYLELVDCSELAPRYPHELSGGQQQRIALARALVYEPSVVLFDEPLSNLDPSLREHLRSQIRTLQRRLGFTGVYVTHDQGEAFYIGDRIALLSRGALLQAGTSNEIFNRPKSPLVARFAGATNMVEGELVEQGRSFVASDLGRISLPTPCESVRSGPHVLLVRPESVRLVSPGSVAPQATVLDRTMVGVLQEYTVRLASGAEWRTRVDSNSARFKTGDVIGLEFIDAVFVFPSPQRDEGDPP
jgi:ABC-type Fe3+/spermidine/putrescine transport system ATPase subunit